MAIIGFQTVDWVQTEGVVHVLFVKCLRCGQILAVGDDNDRIVIGQAFFETNALDTHAQAHGAAYIRLYLPIAHSCWQRSAIVMEEEMQSAI